MSYFYSLYIVHISSLWRFSLLVKVSLVFYAFEAVTVENRIKYLEIQVFLLTLLPRALYPVSLILIYFLLFFKITDFLILKNLGKYFNLESLKSTIKERSSFSSEF